MAKFNAGTAIEKMEFDFSDYDGPIGVIPEPTTAVLDTFMEAVVGLQEKYKDIFAAVGDNDDLEAVASKYDGLSAGDIQSEMTEMIAMVCNGTPSAADILALPYRVQQAFMGWLIGELRPEAPTATSKR